MNTIESKIIELLKSEEKTVVIHCDVKRLYFDNDQWWVRGKLKQVKNAVLYCGDSFIDALIALENK